MKFVAFSEDHLPGVLRLCEAEGWPSFPADPARAVRALTAPGVVTVVAVEDAEVVGFAQLLTDGEIQAYLCGVAVATTARRRGVGTKLIEEAFVRSGAQRVDLLALDESEGFYRSFGHRAMPGYRIYPGGARIDA
jgi:ribosomal protein S18 acetylase RimI-like enzyme